jgi:hypothetical protein
MALLPSNLDKEVQIKILDIAVSMQALNDAAIQERLKKMDIVIKELTKSVLSETK